MDQLEQLHDITLTQPVDWWPLALGWWLVITVFSCCVIAIITMSVLHHRRNRARRAALRELALLTDKNDSPSQQVANINALLKRCASHYFERESVSTLHGKAWQNFLSEHLVPKHQTLFRSLSDEAFESLYYVTVSQNTSDQFLRAAKLWLSKMRLGKVRSQNHV